MRTLLFVVLLLPLMACGGDEPRNVETLTSPAGHEFLFMAMTEKGVTDVAIAIAWTSDWMRRDDVNVAVPYVGAQMVLNGGTQDLRPEEVLELFNDSNATGNLYATPDFLRGMLIFPTDHQADVIGIANQMLRAPQFVPDWLKRTTGHLADDQALANEQDVHGMYSAARYAILGDTPFNTALTLPDPDLIRTVTVADLQDWHRQTITSFGAKIVITGAVTATAAGRMVDDLLNGLPDAQTAVPPAPKVQIPVRTILLHLPASETTTLALMGTMPPFADGATLEDFVATSILGQQGAGPLFDVIRTNLRAAYTVSVELDGFDMQNRLLSISTQVDPAQAADAVAALRTAYEDFRTDPDLTDLDNVKTDMANATAANLGYVDGAALTLIETRLTNEMPITDVPILDKRFEDVTADQVRARLRDGFPSGNDLLIVVASPNANAIPGACVIAQPVDAIQCL